MVLHCTAEYCILYTSLFLSTFLSFAPPLHISQIFVCQPAYLKSGACPPACSFTSFLSLLFVLQLCVFICLYFLSCFFLPQPVLESRFWIVLELMHETQSLNSNEIMVKGLSTGPQHCSPYDSKIRHRIKPKDSKRTYFSSCHVSQILHHVL